MVSSVIAVVEAEAITGNVDESDTGAEIGCRVYFVDESVLAPVADHEAEPEEAEGDNEGAETGLQMDLRRHEGEKAEAGEFGCEGFESQKRFVFAEEIKR